MILNQISVFLENKPGKLLTIIRFLADNQIDLDAMSIAETLDYGILRIVVRDPEKTARLIREAGWSCKITPVLAVQVPDAPGSLTCILKVLAESGINLLYSYAFLSRVQGHACIVLRTEDSAKAEQVLNEAGIPC